MTTEKVTEQTIDLASETLVGDVRDVLLGHIRTLTLVAKSFSRRFANTRGA
jgi:hypothetical protein